MQLTRVSGAEKVVQLSAHSDAALIENFLTLKGARNALTVKAYRQDIEHFQRCIHGRLKDITFDAVQAYHKRLLKERYAPATIRRRLKTLKQLLRYVGNRHADIRLDPDIFDYQLPPLYSRTHERILTHQEVERLIEQADTPRNYAVLLFLYYTGMRVSELCGLTWNDVIPQADGCALVAIRGKGHKERTVGLPSHVWRSVNALRSGRQNSKRNAPVFQSRRGKPLSRSWVHHLIKEAARQAGIVRPVSAHWFRHSHATHSLQGGCSLKLLQERLGHSDIAITGKYLHATPQDSSGYYLPVFMGHFSLSVRNN